MNWSVKGRYDTLGTGRGHECVIGVGDRAEVLGLSEAQVEDTLERLSRLIRSLLPYPADLGVVDLGGRSIVYVSVKKAPPYLSPIFTSSGEVFQRRKDHTIRLSKPEELSHVVWCVTIAL
jgi:hypothetical protein